jgi:hypothetical protein
LETSEAPGAFAGEITEDATFAVEEAGALNLVAGVEVAGFGAIPRPAKMLLFGQQAYSLQL